MFQAVMDARGETLAQIMIVRVRRADPLQTSLANKAIAGCVDKLVGAIHDLQQHGQRVQNSAAFVETRSEQN
jgi:hypothetical protein